MPMIFVDLLSGGWRTVVVRYQFLVTVAMHLCVTFALAYLLASGGIRWRRIGFGTAVLVVTFGIFSCLLYERSEVRWNKGSAGEMLAAVRYVELWPAPLVVSTVSTGHSIGTVMSLAHETGDRTRFPLVAEPEMPVIPDGYDAVFAWGVLELMVDRFGGEGWRVENTVVPDLCRLSRENLETANESNENTSSPFLYELNHDRIGALGTRVMRDLNGRALGHYRILSGIGKGGMGEVYRAHDESLDREVAVKVLPEDVASDLDRLRRFEREARAVARLNHPNILAIHDFGSEGGIAYAVMELLAGESLREVITQGSVTPSKAVEYARAIADGLAAAHEKDIVHRDLKPENVFLTNGGIVKILDFGLARSISRQEDLTTESPTATLETTPGAALGTVPYMSPEQVRGEPCDQRTDIFALGVVLYEMLSGKRPFSGNSMVEIASAVLGKDPPPIDTEASGVPSALANVVMRCLEKRPEDRFSSARDLSLTLGALDSAPPTVDSRQKSVIERRWPHILAVIFAVFIAVFVVFPPEALFDRPNETPATEPHRSIAVLPLDNLSGDPAQEFFVDGMTEALIADLAKIRALKVISRTSVMRYKGTTAPLPEIAAELGVEAIVEGSVVRSGDRVRITAQLIEATTDQHLWAESYERDLTDILALQGEIAREIAREVQVVLTPQEEASLASGAPVDPGSYEAYLLGQYRMKEETIEGGRAALKHFEDAVAKDSNNALAYAGLAEVLGSFGKFWLPPEQADRRAEEAALTALELDETLAEAHFALAYVKYYLQWDWEVAGREFEKALEINPNLSEAHHNYAHLLWTVGRVEEAELENQRYLELDPQWPRPYECMGFHLGMARQYERAVDYFKRGLEIDPTYYYGHTGLGDAYVQLGEIEKAKVSYRAALGLSDDPMAMAKLGLAYVEAIQGNDAEALRMLNLIETEETGVSSTTVASVFAALGDRDEAFAWLERAFREKDVYLTHIERHPWLDPLRDDPRFDDIVKWMDFPGP